MFPSVAWATDHADARRMTRDRRADISDQFVWVPEPGRIAVGVMTRPYSSPRKRFSADVTRRVVVRRATIEGTGSDIEVQTSDEVVIACDVVPGDRTRDDAITCAVEGTALSVTAAIDDEAGTWSGGLRVFAGVRLDPFFVDINGTLLHRARDGDRIELGGSDSITPWWIRGRVQALVVEFDVAALFGDAGGLFAVHSETRIDGQAADRAGRSEITGFILQRESSAGPLPGDDVRSSWNYESTYALSEHHRPAYVAAMRAGLERLDGLDRLHDPRRWKKRVDDPGAGPDWPTPHPLAELFVDQDSVLVDPARPCGHDDSTHLEIEMAHYQAQPPDQDGDRHRTCGGRTLNADVVDSLLTLFINGPDRVPHGPPHYGPALGPKPRRGDGVDRPRDPATDEFPYLHAP